MITDYILWNKLPIYISIRRIVFLYNRNTKPIANPTQTTNKDTRKRSSFYLSFSIENPFPDSLKLKIRTETIVDEHTRVH